MLNQMCKKLFSMKRIKITKEKSFFLIKIALYIILSIVTLYVLHKTGNEVTKPLRPKTFVLFFVFVFLYAMLFKNIMFIINLERVYLRKSCLLNKNNFFLNILNFTFLSVLFWILLNVIIANKCGLVHYNMVIIFIFALLAFPLIISLEKYIERISIFLDNIGRKRYIVLGIVIIIFFTIQIRLGYALEFRLMWDAGIVFSDSVAAANTGHIANNSYFLLYPNNLGILFLLTSFFKILKFIGITQYYSLAILLNIFIMDITIIIIYLICEKIFDTKSAVISLCFSLLFIVLSGWVSTPYTDVITMIFPVLIFYVYLIVKDTHNNILKNLLYILMGGINLIAYRLKPTSILIMIAIIFVLFINNIKNLKYYIKKFMLIAVSFIICSIAFNCYIDATGILNYKLNNSSKYNTPITYFLMLGMQKSVIPSKGTLYGAYNYEDAFQNINLKNKSSRIKYDTAEIQKRLRGFGVAGYIKFLSDKASWIFSDGTFYSYGEGSLRPYFHKDKISSNIQSFMFIKGKNYKYFSSFQQIVWIILLFFIIYPLFTKKMYGEKQEISILRITLLGLVVFLLIFEGRSRYLYNNIGIFIITSIYGYNLLIKNFMDAQKELKIKG